MQMRNSELCCSCSPSSFTVQSKENVGLWYPPHNSPGIQFYCRPRIKNKALSDTPQQSRHNVEDFWPGPLVRVQWWEVIQIGISKKEKWNFQSDIFLCRHMKSCKKTYCSRMFNISSYGELSLASTSYQGTAGQASHLLGKPQADKEVASGEFCGFGSSLDLSALMSLDSRCSFNVFTGVLFAVGLPDDTNTY